MEENFNYKENAIDFLKTFSIRLSNSETSNFIEICDRYQLDPFKKEIHLAGNKIVVGYEVYLKRAEKTGRLAGWKTEFSMEDKELCCTCEIHRHDWKFPLVHKVYMSEYAQNSPIWKKMPRMMLRKCAISSAFRLAFPCELGGMAYDGAELGVEVIPEKTDPQSMAPSTPKLNTDEEQKLVFDILAAIDGCKDFAVLDRYRNVAKKKGLSEDSLKIVLTAMEKKESLLRIPVENNNTDATIE